MSLDWDQFKSAQYGYVTGNRSPCSDGYANQCALRVSNALVDAGWPFNGPNQPYTSTRFGPLCNHQRARGARTLADYLEVYLRFPKKYTIPPHPVTRMVEESAAGVYFQESSGDFKYYKVMDWLEKKAGEGQALRGIIYFNSPDHIDGFDLADSSNTKGPQGIIGESYANSSSEIRVFFV